MNRKKPLHTLLTGMFVTLALILSACGGAPADVPPGELTGSLSVLDWAGYDTEDFWIDFKNTYPNVTVGFEFGTSDADIYAKMAAGNQADVFHPYSGWLQFYVDEGLVEEIDTSKLANWDKVSDAHKKLGQFNGKQYFIPWDIGFTSVLYRTDKIPEGGRFVGGAPGSEVRGSYLDVGRRSWRGNCVFLYPRL